jgi:hypothetical protein
MNLRYGKTSIVLKRNGDESSKTILSLYLNIKVLISTVTLHCNVG